jgi:hypothetical protein
MRASNVSLSKDQQMTLKGVAAIHNCTWGAEGSISRLMRAIADGKLVLSESSDPSTPDDISDSPITIIKKTSPMTLARINANTAHFLLSADCKVEAKLHIELAIAYALIEQGLDH